MKLKISSFADPGNFQKERVVIKALQDEDVGEYTVFCSAISEQGSPTGGRKTAFWFPDEEVKAGDLVVLYSKKGTASKKELTSGVTAHFFYWGLDHAIWGSDGNTAVLLKVEEWRHLAPKK